MPVQQEVLSQVSFPRFRSRGIRSLRDKSSEAPISEVGVSFADRARDVIARQMLAGGGSVQSIARELGTSGRTLQRRLQEQGTSLQALMASVRCELAVELLTGAERPASEVAERLGFSAPSAFHRAFKRWTGHTPGEFRKVLSEAEGVTAKAS